MATVEGRSDFRREGKSDAPLAEGANRITPNVLDNKEKVPFYKYVNVRDNQQNVPITRKGRAPTESVKNPEQNHVTTSNAPIGYVLLTDMHTRMRE